MQALQALQALQEMQEIQEIQEIREDNFSVTFNEQANIISFEGTVRLPGIPDYEPIKNILHDVYRKSGLSNDLKLNFSKLKFLNSSGITTISMFIIQARKENIKKVSVIGSRSIPWQEKSLHNLHKLWNDVEVIMGD